MNLLKKTPLVAKGRKLNAATVTVGDWQVIEHFDNKEIETNHLQEHAIIVDWSHIGKIDIQGHDIDQKIENLFSLPEPLNIGSVYSTNDIAVLKLLKNRYLVLTQPEEELNYFEKLEKEEIEYINVTGAKSCLALAGPKKQNLIERASAINLTLDAFPNLSVAQTTVHTIISTIVRIGQIDLFIIDQTYCESLFDAFIDFSESANLIPAGLATLPISFKGD